MKTTFPNIPTGLSRTETRAFQELFRDAKDGVINKREADAFGARYHSLFEKGDHRWLRYAVQELTHPGTTYAYYHTPKARLTEGAQKSLDALNGGQNWWMK